MTDNEKMNEGKIFEILAKQDIKTLLRINRKISEIIEYELIGRGIIDVKN